MQLLKTTIKPISNFAATPRGDTLFGQLCWMIHFCYGKKRLEELLVNYDKKPFMIVSDAFVSGYLPKPKLPSRLFLQDENADKKKERKKQWIKYDDLQTLTNTCESNEDKQVNTMHNSINRKILTTDNENFAPYALQEVIMSEKDIYCLIDEGQFSKNELNEVFEMLRDYGYGKDTSIGKGRFTFSDFIDVTQMIQKSSTAFMTLSPFSPQGLPCKDIYYELFTRFGKKGALRAKENPFKRPLLLADTASVVIFDEPCEKQYIGKAIGVHSTHKDIVHQGYAITVAIKEIS
ncbi:MAG: hypothetical protein LBG21_02155 [Campylobacteraceae bacterium]|jgi:CRISPR-associated protein Csm4|nr:hypothetical protein [Campylobacteraceae bacterium]